MVVIKPSTRAEAKYMAVFENPKKTVHFGAAGYEDYTTHGDEERKKSYLARHKPRENWDDPRTAGSLSRWILWNKKSLNASIRDFKNRFPRE
tara:strand:+ start:1223 stop:1498 length:276 start_codon:yes stop_codon:yes gene_type:complete